MRLLIVTVFALLLAACSSVSGEKAPEDLATLAPGDPARGATLFAQPIDGAPACATCHSVNGSALNGPSMQGFSARASTRVENTSAEDYARNSILHPAEFVVTGFSNVMYAQYEKTLSPQQLADLIAYLLTL